MNADALVEFEVYYKQLQSLESNFYPRKCNNCNKVYETPDSFLLETKSINSSGIKISEDDDGSTILEVFRNCTCGSTLLGNYSDRRDLTEEGVQRRKIFAELHGFLVSQGMDHDMARRELRNLFNGEKANLQFLPRQ